ncbi:MFS transporter [Burkholderia cepacia]|uniref:MFS transporter n=2 Tax=Burkholderia cepacia TaxID=292 RepID=UPI002ED99811
MPGADWCESAAGHRSIGPLLPSISQAFGLSHTEASMLPSIPDVLMGLLALPTPWLARRFGRDRVILAALFVLFAATLGRAFAGSVVQILLLTDQTVARVTNECPL